MEYLIVFVGAGLGGAARHGTNLLAQRLLGLDWPSGTLIVNVVGSLVMGLLAEWFALKAQAPQHLRLLLTTGLLGGYTTFSTFSLDVALLLERGQPSAALLYGLGSVLLGVIALFLGLYIVRLTVGAP